MTRRSLVLSFLLLGLLMLPVLAQQVPVVLNYQATLAENGQQVEGTRPVVARVFDAETGGQLLWEERRSLVAVERGRLSLLLGSVEPFPPALFDGADRYLEIEIDGERMPRLRMASTAYALRADVAQTARRADAVAADAAVTSINQVAGDLTLKGENGATVNVDPSTGTIIVSASGGSGGTSGIFGVQNSDGTLQVVDPNGPTVTINIQPGSIGPVQIADGGVRTADLADAAVTTRKIADDAVTSSKLARGVAVTQLTAGTGLLATGTTGAITLSIADDGVTAAQLAENAVTRRALAGGVVVDGLNGLTGGINLTSSDQSISIAASTGLIDLTLAPDALVTSVNTLRGDLRFAAAGGASVTVDESTGTITVSAPQADGTGVAGIQNTDGTLQITDPNGPTTTINLQDKGIGEAQLDDQSVTALKLASRAVGASTLNAIGPAGTGQVLSFAGNGQFAWIDPAQGTLTGVTATGGLRAAESGGEVEVAIQDQGITEPMFATGAVSSRAIADGGVARADLAPTAAVTTLGIGTDVLSGDVFLQGGSNISVNRVPNQNAYQIDFTGTLDGLVTSVSGVNGLATVVGPTGDVQLGVANQGIGTAQLSDGAVTRAKLNPTGIINSALVEDNTLTAADLAPNAVGTSELNATAPGLGQVLGFDGTGLSWTDLPTADGDITGVTAEGGLSGSAASGEVILSITDGGVTTGKVASDAITEPKLNATNAPGPNQVLSHDGSNRFTWVDPAAGAITDVTAQNGLTATKSGSEVALSIADGGVNGPQLATSALAAGDNVNIARDGSGNIEVSVPGVLTSAVQSIAADGQTLAGDLSFATSGSASVTVSGSTVTFGAAAGLTSVASDNTLTGEGTSGSVLGLADNAVSATKLATNAVTTGAMADGAVDAAKLALGAVTTSAVVDEAITEAKLAALNTPTEGQVLRYESGNLTWTAPSAPVTTDGSTLTGDGTTTPLQILQGGVTSTELGADAVTTAAIATGAVGTDALADGSIAAADINASGAINGYALIYDDTVVGNSLVWRDPAASTSSMRFKTGVQTIGDAQEIVDRLRGVRFHWTTDGRPDVGLIAEEVARVLPELVTYETDETTVRGLRYAPLVAVLIEAAKAQQSALNAATQTVEAQRVELDALNDRVARLEALVQSIPEAASVSTK